MTSNLGTGERKRRMGFGAAEDEDVGGTPTLLEAVRRHFRPELVNRLTGIVPFAPIGMETAREIVGKLIDEWNTRLAGRGVTMEFSEEAVDLLLREGFIEQYGARNLERTMDRLLGPMVSEAVLSGKISTGQRIQLDVIDGRIQISQVTA